MNVFSTLIPVCSAGITVVLTRQLKAARITFAQFWASGALLMAVIWYAYHALAPATSAAEATFTNVLYTVAIVTLSALALACSRRARRPGWYGGQHERIDNP